MKICTKPKTPAEFTTDVADLLNLSATHIYFDTSFLMWLTMIGGEARLQFIEWAKTLGERTHVPLWSMHEYYRHHTGGTLRSDLANRADSLEPDSKAYALAKRRMPS
jgi:hypothetical protein